MWSEGEASCALLVRDAGALIIPGRTSCLSASQIFNGASYPFYEHFGNLIPRNFFFIVVGLCLWEVPRLGHGKAWMTASVAL